MSDGDDIDVGPSADDLLAQFDALNTSYALAADAPSADDGAGSASASADGSVDADGFQPAHRWHERFAALGLCLCGGDASTGRHLTAGSQSAFRPGDVLLRETPAIWVGFDEPFSALESKLMEHFNIQKIAPPYRLLARAIEHDRTQQHSAGVGGGAQCDLLLDSTSVVMSMAANLEVANDGWPAKFCTFLADAGEADGEAVTRLLAIIKTNAFGVYDVSADGLANRGLGLYVMAGRANHVCDPSAVWAFDGQTLVLRAVRALGEGDAVTISYLLPREAVSARRHKLRESYRFECACTRCVREEPTGKKLDAAAGEFRQLRTGLEELSASGQLGEDHTNAIERCGALLEQLTPADHAHPESATLLLQLGRYWHVVGGRCKGAKKARVYRERAAAHLRRARGMVSVSLGVEHPVMAAVDSLLDSISPAQPTRSEDKADAVTAPPAAAAAAVAAAAAAGTPPAVADVSDPGAEGTFILELAEARLVSATTEAAREAASSAAEGEARWVEAFWFGGQQKKHGVRLAVEGRSGLRATGPLESGEDAAQFEARWRKLIAAQVKKVDVEDLGMMDAARLWDAIPEEDGAGRGRRDLEALEKDLSVKAVFSSNGHVLLVGAKAKLQKKTFVLRNLLSHYHWRLSGRDVAFEQMVAK